METSAAQLGAQSFQGQQLGNDSAVEKYSISKVTDAVRISGSKSYRSIVDPQDPGQAENRDFDQTPNRQHPIAISNCRASGELVARASYTAMHYRFLTFS